MKLVFSTKHVNRASFLDLCRYAYDYGYTGFEIYDALKERRQHVDSVLRNDRTADSKRKLLNRGLSVSALTVPQPVESEEVTSDVLVRYVDMARGAGIERVIVRMEEKLSNELLEKKLAAAIRRAEKADVQILLETVGYLAETENVTDIINFFSSV